MRLLQQIPDWVKNKYFLTAFTFLLWVTFFDDRDLINNIRHTRELKQLEQSRNYYTQLIEETKEELQQLKTSPATLEKFAREKYRMKRENEDLFILNDKQEADNQ
jgi:cell division protein FtsB